MVVVGRVAVGHIDHADRLVDAGAVDVLAQQVVVAVVFGYHVRAVGFDVAHHRLRRTLLRSRRRSSRFACRPRHVCIRFPASHSSPARGCSRSTAPLLSQRQARPRKGGDRPSRGFHRRRRRCRRKSTPACGCRSLWCIFLLRPVLVTGDCVLNPRAVLLGLDGWAS